MEKQIVNKTSKEKQHVKREYSKAIAEITKLQRQLDQLEQKAQRCAHQLFATA